jgi:tetratricopeptide (TPR) repeat protein
MRCICLALVSVVMILCIQGVSWGTDQTVPELMQRVHQLMIKGDMQSAGELCMQALLAKDAPIMTADIWEIIRLLDEYDAKYQDAYCQYAQALELMDYGYLPEAQKTLEGIPATSELLDCACADKLARIAGGLGELDEALQQYQTIYERYPNSDYAPWALYNVNELLLTKDNKGAEEYRRLLEEQYPESVPAQMLAQKDVNSKEEKK